jgi:serine/threonine protein kinase
MVTMTSDRRVLQDRYQLLYKLGAGGMGSVWLAEDTRLKRTVALKELVQHVEGTDLDERRARALQEARAMARMRHPAIVSIYDVFFDRGDPWIVMEHINGRSLSTIIKEAKRAGRPLDEQTIATIGLPVLHGLCAAHRVDVVHRDVKPANILVADDNSIFLVDFGIAKITGDVSLTGKHTVLGTLEFLAPERLRGEATGPAADLWSLGVTLFSALEGYSPFVREGETAHAAMWAILRGEPPAPTRKGPLAEVILRLLDRNPGSRANADELASVLQSIVASRPPTKAVPSQASTQPMVPPAARPTGPPRTTRPPGQRLPRPANVKPPRLPPEEAREMVMNASIDTGVEMLLAMPDEDAAKILVGCPSHVGRELLQGIAASKPNRAGAIVRMLLPADAGRIVGYLKPNLAAALLATAPADDAARIICLIGVRTAAGIISKMPMESSAPLIQAMPVARAAEVLAYVQPAVVAALLLAIPYGTKGGVLQQLKPAFRAQVLRHLLSHVQ